VQGTPGRVRFSLFERGLFARSSPSLADEWIAAIDDDLQGETSAAALQNG
jgi:hypothetical protein